MLTLKPMTYDYLDEYLAHINDYDIVKMTGTIPYPVTRDWLVTRFDAKTQQEANGKAANRIVLRGDEFVGDGGYFTNEEGGIEIGYWIAKSFWGQGIATILTGQLIDLARSDGHTGDLYAGHAIDNPASGRVLEKAGFRRTGEGSFPSKARGGDVPCWRYIFRS